MSVIDPPNVVQIQPQGRSYGMTPLFPAVKPGYQPLIVSVAWGKNMGFWNRVVCKDFTLPDGTPCDVFPKEIDILLGDGSRHEMFFNFVVQEPTACKFTVELHRVSPAEVFVIDPGIILNPGP
jgi:hypothetical protein